MTFVLRSSKLAIGIFILLVNVNVIKCSSFGFGLIHVAPDNFGKEPEDYSVEDDLEVNDLLSFESIQVANNEASLEKVLSRYTVHTYARPWFDAVTACWREGGNLAAPSDEIEALRLGRMLKVAIASRNISNTEMKDAMHVGVNNFGTRGEFYTIDENEVKYMSWFKGGRNDVPLVDFPEQCVSLLTNGQSIQHHCGDKLIYACDHQKRDDSKESGFESKYKPLGEEGFYHLHTEPLPWIEAEGICEMEGAKLATPSSGRELGFLSGVVLSRPELPAEVRTGGVYIGVNDLVTEGIWRDVKGGYVYHPDIWATNRPTNDRSSNCASMLRSGLIDVPCSEPKAFLCEKRVEEVIPEYEELENLGRYSLHTEEKTWLQAAFQCHLENASLAVIDSEKEAKALDNFIKERSLKLNKPYYHVLVGIHKLDGRKWRTIDGTSLEKTGFNELSASQFSSPTLACGGFYEAKYSETLCGQRSMYICEKQL